MEKIDRLIQDFKKIIKNYDESYFLDDFENKLFEIHATENPEIIFSLIHLLDDSFEFDELMFSIIHVIESFEDSIYINQVLKTIPTFIQNSPRWASIIFIRIINSESSNQELIKQINLLDKEKKEALKKLFESISDLGEELKIKLEPILNL